MNDLFLLSEVQMRGIEPYFPRSHGAHRPDAACKYATESSVVVADDICPERVRILLVSTQHATTATTAPPQVRSVLSKSQPPRRKKPGCHAHPRPSPLFTIFPCASTTHTIDSSNDTSIPA